MTDEPDVLALLAAYHDHIQAPPAQIEDDVRRGRRRLWRDRGLITATVAATIAGVGVAAWLGSGGLVLNRTQPVAPRPTDASPAPSSSQTPTVWTGPLGRTPSTLKVYGDLGPSGNAWADGPDSAVGGVDIQEIQQRGQPRWRWTLQLREFPPPASTLGAKNQIIEYGLVVDADGDRVADCQIGINNEAPRPGDYRVWVKNLTTGETDERVGPPYGYPVEFIHPDEAEADGSTAGSPEMTFLFLQSTTPCEDFDDGASFYAWASRTDDGLVVAWDFAPDATWLAMMPS